MTTSLDSYLRGPFKEDTAFLNRLTKTIEEVIPVFRSQCKQLPIVAGKKKSLVKSWPYAVADEPDSRGPHFSWSTHCMILFALDALIPRGKDKHSILIGELFRSPSLSSNHQGHVRSLVDSTKRTLVTVLGRWGTTMVPGTTSGTYGENDPFTLTWLTEIVFRWMDQPDVTPNQLEQCKQKLRDAINTVFRRKQILDTGGTDFSEVTGSFLRVRRLHLALAAKRIGGRSAARSWLKRKTPELWADFDETIHRQLSFSSMKEQKFDPAELAFAFEGALLLHPNWVSRAMVDQVFEALALSQESHPFWRPVAPFLANQRGHVLFLVSIEVANSLLRSCEILDAKEGMPTRFAQFEPQMRTYTMWLLGEKKEVRSRKPREPNLVGWRTEYETKRDIQLWHTSHVVVFLAHYAALLKRKIMAEGIEAAGLQVRPPDLNKDYWKSEPLHSLATRVGKSPAERPYAVLQRIKKHYIEPWRRVDERTAKAAGLYSMLLYGPPGTGKTTVAEQIAAALKRQLIVITVSDFLAAGAAEIENRAKGVFQVLNSLEEVVILFDEIDQFLLDRNSALYKAQNDIFKFMTPGMLTKLQDLRDGQNCIFIIATNYYERIDSAIKRRGRLDEHFLLNIPDKRRRLKILETFILEVLRKELKNDRNREDYEAAATNRTQRAFLKSISDRAFGGKFKSALNKSAKSGKDVLTKTALFGWGDLENLVKSKTQFQPGMDLNSLVAALESATGEVEPAVGLSAYVRRFEEKGLYPYEEFFLLLYVLAENDATPSNQDKIVIEQVLELIGNWPDECPPKPPSDKFLKEYGIKDPVAFVKASNYLKKHGFIPKPKKEEKK